jgi:hypothetical protein
MKNINYFKEEIISGKDILILPLSFPIKISSQEKILRGWSS